MGKIMVKIINFGLTLIFLYISVKYIKEPFVVYFIGELIGTINFGIYLLGDEDIWNLY